MSRMRVLTLSPSRTDSNPTSYGSNSDQSAQQRHDTEFVQGSSSMSMLMSITCNYANDVLLIIFVQPAPHIIWECMVPSRSLQSATRLGKPSS